MFASKDVSIGQRAAYPIARSVRFRASASAYLSRTPTVASNRRTWTFSAWVKKTQFTGTAIQLFSAYSDINNGVILFSTSTEGWGFQILSGGSSAGVLTTSAAYRDPSAWYHVMIACDTTQATSSERMKIYVNGVQLTAFVSATYPTQNFDTQVNNAVAHAIAARAVTPASYFDCYVAEVNFIDGQALTPSSFGAFNIYGVWQPAKYQGTYGTNGFYLKFDSYATAAALGTDSSGNSNTWTVNNINVTAYSGSPPNNTSYDAMTDVPTLTSATAANYPTWNPLWQGRTNAPTSGNLDYPASSVGIGTMALSGSIYWEITSTGGTSTVALYSTAVSTSQTVTTGLTYGFRFNATTGAFDYTTNGSSFTSIATGLTSGPYFFYVSTAAATTASLNAGQRPFSYTPPTGFNALNTFSLANPAIPNGAAQMGATIYTGDGTANRVISGLSFTPDFVWIKNRSSTWDNILGNYVVKAAAGTPITLVSNSTAAEVDGGYIGTQTANSLKLATSAGENRTNGSTLTYVAWLWKAGTGLSTNTNGSITSTVNASTSSGFSIVTYTGTGAAATVGHGLSAVPSLIIVKGRTTAGDPWAVYSSSLANTQYLYLNTTAAVATGVSLWNSTTPTSSVFTIGAAQDTNRSAGSLVAYCFAPVAGYSAFGSYTGNGSADGPFVYLGFRPRFTLIKRTDAIANWRIHDTARDTYNVASNTLYPNLLNAETSAASEYWDILSNGIKLRTSDAESNASGGTYIYMCFAENPFKYALAR